MVRPYLRIMQKRKIVVVTGNRADYSRLKSVLRAMQARDDLIFDLVVTGSHLLEKYGSTIREIEQDGFPISYKIHIELAGENPAAMTKSVGLGIIELANFFENVVPDVVVVPVDRFESLAMATAAALMNIPVAHTQGGEVTGTIDESIRHAITKLAHIHFAATEGARQRIIKMGEPDHLVFNVGCPGTDVLLQAPQWNAMHTVEHVNIFIKDERYKLDPYKPYLLVMQHPVTTEFGSGLAQINATLEAVADTGMQGVMLWPNIDAGSDDISKGIRLFLLANPEMKLAMLKHFPTDVFVNLVRNAACMVGNSSSGIREAGYFGTPVVNIGTRQAGRDRGSNVCDAGNSNVEIRAALNTQLSHGCFTPNTLYGDGTAGVQIAQLLATMNLPHPQKRITY